MDTACKAQEPFRVAQQPAPAKAGGAGDPEEHLLILLILYRCHITQDRTFGRANFGGETQNYGERGRGAILVG